MGIKTTTTTAQMSMKRRVDKAWYDHQIHIIAKMNVPKCHTIIWMNLSNEIWSEKVNSNDYVEQKYIFIKIKTLKNVCVYTYNCTHVVSIWVSILYSHTS